MPSSNAKIISNKDSSETDNSKQSVVYGVLPDQSGDAIDFGELIFNLFSQWKIILSILLVGTTLAVLMALTLPKVYQSSITVSVPLEGNVASISSINKLLGGEKKESIIPSNAQAIFTYYYNLLRSERVFEEYLKEKNYIQTLYPESNGLKFDVLASNLSSGLKFEIIEPTPEAKGSYIASPERVNVNLEIYDDVIGAELLNGFAIFVNQWLITNLQNDAHEIINNKIETLSQQIKTQREKHKQKRLLTIKKIELENAEKVAQIKEHISASLKTAKANRKSKIAHAKESLEIAKSLNIINPTTMETLAQRDQKGPGTNAAITLVDKPSSSLYLLGTKYLTTLIETLEKRTNDEKYLVDINTLKEEIQLIENDQALIALKRRVSDDPWIEELPTKLAEIDALKRLNPDFKNLVAFNIDEAALVTGKPVKPNKSRIIIIGFVLSLTIGISIALLICTIKKITN